MAGHTEERPTMPQPQCGSGRCHRAGTGQTTLEVTGSKLNNDDDDESDISQFLSTASPEMLQTKVL